MAGVHTTTRVLSRQLKVVTPGFTGPTPFWSFSTLMEVRYETLQTLCVLSTGSFHRLDSLLNRGSSSAHAPERDVLWRRRRTARCVDQRSEQPNLRWWFRCDWGLLVRRDIERYITMRSEKVSAGTVRKEVGVLKHLLNFAVDNDMIQANPAG